MCLSQAVDDDDPFIVLTETKFSRLLSKVFLDTIIGWLWTLER